MRKTIILVAALLVIGSGIFAQESPAQQAQAPPPQNPQDQKDVKYTNESVARLSYVNGKAFVQRASDLGYTEGALNMPISQGDRIGTSDGRVEVHFGRSNYIRLDNETKLDVLNLPKKDDDIARLRVWSGNVFLVVGSLRKEKGIELHTADSSFYVLDKGVFRVDVRENKDTEILVYQGLIEVAGEDGSTLLKAGQKLDISEGRFASKPSTFIPVADDSFDKFNESRASVTGREFAQSKLPEELSDYEGELDEYGEWQYLAPYGNVWVPNEVDDDWRPYYDGQWTWLPLSGWTWWPYEPWGWATFHYGRWNWGVGFGWYWIPMNVWGPAWVDWWWDDFYFGWAPLSYWGYPGVWYGGAYYGHYYGPYYPHYSNAMTVVRRDALKDPHISRNALKGDDLKGLNNKITMTNKAPNLRPAGSKISVQPLSGKQVLLRNDGATGFARDAGRGREAGGAAGATSGPRAVRQPSDPGKASGGTAGTAAKPQSVKSPSGGKSGSPASGKSSGKSGGVQKKDGQPATSASSATSFRSDPAVAGQSRTANGYPSSPRIKGPSSYGDGGSGRARTFSGPYSRPSSFGGSSIARPSSGRSGGSGGSSVRSGGSRSGSSSGRSSGSVSRGSSSRGSSSRSSGGSRSSGSSSRGSSGGSRGSSGGSAHRK